MCIRDRDSKEAIFHYFQELLDLKGNDAQDQKKILSLIQSGAMPFRTIAEQFHLIESGTRTVYIPKGEGAGYADRLRQGERSRSLFRKLGQYGVCLLYTSDVYKRQTIASLAPCRL